MLCDRQNLLTSYYIYSVTSTVCWLEIKSILCRAFCESWNTECHPFFFLYPVVTTQIYFSKQNENEFYKFSHGKSLSAFSDNLRWNDMVWKLDFLVSFPFGVSFLSSSYFSSLLSSLVKVSATYKWHRHHITHIINNHFCFVALFYVFFVSVFHIFSIVCMENVDHVWCVV